jgi:hypothetical protein
VTTPQYPFGEQPSDDDPFRQQDTFGPGSDPDDHAPQDPYDPFARASRPAEQPAYYPPPPAGYGPPTSVLPGPPQGPQGPPPRHTVRNILLGVVGAVVLVGVIAGVAVALSSGGGTGKPAASTSRAASPAAAATSAAAPTASAGTLGCAAQLLTWQAGPGGQLFTKVQDDSSALGAGLGNGGSSAGSSAAARLGTEARQAAAHPMPSCVDPAGNYTKAMTQWSQGAADAAAGNITGEVTAITQGDTYLSKTANEIQHVAAGATAGT